MMTAVHAESLVDRRISTLSSVLEPYKLRPYLGEVLPTAWGGLRDVSIDVLQYHRASRCTVNIKLQTTTGARNLIGKVYATDRSDVYEAMKQITRSGFDSEAALSIPKPLAYIPELRLLLQERVQGPLATEIFVRGNEDQRRLAAVRCAEWLAHFHAHAPKTAPVFQLTSEFMEFWAQRLAKRAERVVDKAMFLFNRIKARGFSKKVVNFCGCHGTYCHYQIILSNARTVTLDWDAFCLSHPTLDVARFIVILRQLALECHGSFGAFDSAAEIFLNTYVAKTRFAVTDLPVYKAALCLKHAKDYVKKDFVRPEMAEKMLDEGLRILEEEI